MKPTACLINTAWGDNIDPNDPLLKLDNVILTGYSAFASVESIAEMNQWPIEEVAKILEGEWPQNPVNPEVKERFEARWGRMPGLIC